MRCQGANALLWRPHCPHRRESHIRLGARDALRFPGPTQRAANEVECREQPFRGDRDVCFTEHEAVFVGYARFGQDAVQELVADVVVELILGPALDEDRETTVS